MDILHEPWPWYVGGPAIAFTMFLLIFLGKEFGVSANLRTIVCMCGGKGPVNFLISIGKSKAGIWHF